MRTLYILILLMAFGCRTKERPQAVLTQAQLSALIVEIYLAEAKLETVPKSRDTTIKYFIPFEEKLLKQSGISDSVLRITYAYYVAHPKELERVYDSVIDTLTLHEQRGHLAPSRPK